MAIRGIRSAGLIELAAIIVIGAFIALLTLVPWWVAALAYGAFWVGALRLRRWEMQRAQRRIRRLEECAQLERDLLRAESERSDALRCRGGAYR